jgi:hypothetical protein
MKDKVLKKVSLDLLKIGLDTIFCSPPLEFSPLLQYSSRTEAEHFKLTCLALKYFIMTVKLHFKTLYTSADLETV